MAEKKKHKAPTQVTLVKSEKSPFAEWVESNWKMGAIVVVVVGAVILISQYRGQQARAGRDAEWTSLVRAQRTGEPEELMKAAEAELVGTGLDAWAFLMAAQLEANARDYDQAITAAERVAQTGQPLLTELRLPIGEGGAEHTIAEALRSTIAAQASQDEALAGKFVNPEPAADAPRVALEVQVGGATRTMILALYPDHAPEHVANFLAQVEAGTYDGVKFHQVIEGFKIQTGDPKTKDQDVSQWGREEPAAEGLAPEESGLVHAPMSVSAVKSTSGPQASKTQFYVVVEAAHHQDDLETVFGTVTEGQDVVREIAGLPTREASAGAPAFVPQEPVPTIVSAKRVEG